MHRAARTALTTLVRVMTRVLGVVAVLCTVSVTLPFIGASPSA
jgi:hypothetical protein